MPTRDKHIINVHTGTGTTEPSGADLFLGEIAVQHTPDNPALWIKVGTGKTSDVYEKFIGETEITNLLSESDILGSGYTYSGLPYVNSSTTIADAYSAITSEVVAGLSAVVESNEYVAAMALNDLDRRITEISGNTGGDVDPLSAAVISLSAAVITISGSTGGGGDIQSLSSATHTHINNNDIHVTAADKTTWTNGANSGASAWTAVTELSAATTAHTGNAPIHVPTGGTDGQYLSLVNGAPTWSTPVTVYSGENPPAQSLGNNGDIYIQTS